MKIAISSGHGKYVRGASGYLDEVDEARRVVNQVGQYLHDVDIECFTYHDDTSKSQSENLNRIVSFHNSMERELDVSIHFNAYETTGSPMGTECLYLTQSELAANVAGAIAKAGSLKNRGGKKRTDLAFLNNTDEPAILIEVCFVDSQADARLYEDSFEDICAAITEAIADVEIDLQPPAPEPAPPSEVLIPTVTIKIDPPESVRVIIQQ